MTPRSPVNTRNALAKSSAMYLHTVPRRPTHTPNSARAKFNAGDLPTPAPKMRLGSTSRQDSVLINIDRWRSLPGPRREVYLPVSGYLPANDLGVPTSEVGLLEDPPGHVRYGYFESVGDTPRRKLNRAPGLQGKELEYATARFLTGTAARAISARVRIINCQRRGPVHSGESFSG
jgi:hypothetical protein